MNEYLGIASSQPTQTPDNFETTVFGTGAERHEISLGNLMTAKKRERS
jgi:hypothetical protein